MSRTRLVLIPASASRPAPWLILDAAGNVLERGLLSLEGPVEGPAIRTVAVVPGSDVLVRWLDLPKGTAAQQRTAALWMLKDDLAATPDRVRLVLGPAVAGEPRLTAVVSDALLHAWTDWLATMGLKADVLVPDTLTVPEPFDDDVLSAVGFGPAVALRGRRFAAGIEPDLAETVAGRRRIEPVEDMRRVEQMLITAALNPPLNLLQGAPRAAADLGRWRVAAILAAAAVAMPLVSTLALAARDEVAAGRAIERAETAAKAAFPDMPAAADPVSEARRRIATSIPPGGVAPAAAALFAAVESVDGAELDSFSADPEAGVRATVSFRTYQDMDTLKARVAAAGLTLIDSSTLDDNGRVVSDVIVGAGQ
ncbi:MAG TPA: type II secretion system protein GspL [Brevundimonas sp.]